VSARPARPAATAGGAAANVGSLRLQAPLGQGDALARWTTLARKGTLPHGFLIAGPRGSGKSTVMAWMAAALLCPSDLDPAHPCGMCSVCTSIANGRHPDVHLLDLAHDDADRKAWKKSFYVITVEQVRRAQAALQRHAVAGRARILWIEDADCLDDEGQNALLKTLEEPAVATFLLLEATRPERLLPTVHSRLQRLAVLPLAEGLLRQQLQQRIPQQVAHVERAIAVARGSLGAAMLACTEHAVQIHDLVLGMLAEPDRLRPVATARAVLAGQAELHQKLDTARLFLWLLRAELAAARDALAADATSTYGAPSAEPWTTWLEHTLAAERDLDLLIPAEQVLCACLLSFAR
jgi:DNA polymerase-3 subunit delta'